MPEQVVMSDLERHIINTNQLKHPLALQLVRLGVWALGIAVRLDQEAKKHEAAQPGHNQDSVSP
jgi:hypothetical protein